VGIEDTHVAAKDDASTTTDTQVGGAAGSGRGGTGGAAGSGMGGAATTGGSGGGEDTDAWIGDAIVLDSPPEGDGSEEASDARSDGGPGVCEGPTVYFYEPFADNGAGWMLGTEWQIGPAAMSAATTHGFPDPDADHTPTDDNGIAGVVIGGTTATSVHAPYYLTSPAVDTSGASTVMLTFWRWLNSDSGDWMRSTVDVWDGTGWVNLYTNAGGSRVWVTDDAWTKIEYDVSAYKNAAFRVRFGVAIVQNFALTFSSWNVDDVVLSSQSCP
jgi:hypothetical protein